jgi:hypothetical protein
MSRPFHPPCYGRPYDVNSTRISKLSIGYFSSSFSYFLSLRSENSPPNSLPGCPQSVFFLQGNRPSEVDFCTKILSSFLVSSILDICPTNHIFLDFTVSPKTKMMMINDKFQKTLTVICSVARKYLNHLIAL